MQGKRKVWLAGVIVAVLSLTFLVAACDDDEDGGEATATSPAGGTPTEAAGEGTTITGQVTEWSITVDPATAPAGSVTFEVENTGGEVHEFEVFKTDLDSGALPTKDDGSADTSGLEDLGEIEEDELQPGDSATLTLDLEAGAYVLVCNVVETEESGEIESHYAEGMHTGFEVTE